MFQLLITVNLKSGVGAGVAISTTVASFTSERLAEAALDELGSFSTSNKNSVFSSRRVERLYKLTKK